MAAPLPSAKPKVTLDSSGAPVSRIRRDPAPVVKVREPIDQRERDAWMMVIGISAFALAFTIIIIAMGVHY